MPEDRTSLTMPSGLASSLVPPCPEGGVAKRLRVRVRVLAAIVVLLTTVVGGGVWLWRWDHSLALFTSGGNEASGLVPINRTVYALVMNGNPLVGALAQRTVTVNLTSVRPQVQLNAAAATIRVLTCAENGEIVAVGAVRSLSYCHAPVPFLPGPQHISPDLHSTAIVLAITAHRPGRLDIEGVDIAYRSGARSGQQNTGLRLNFRASTAWR